MTDLPTKATEKPRLLWVNHFAVSPRDGGGTRHFEMGRALVRRGWNVQLAASDLNLHSRTFTRRERGARQVVPEVIEEVEFRWLWAASYERNDWRRLRNWLTFSRSLWRDAGAIAKPSVVIGSSPHLFAALTAQRLAARWKVPFVFEVRDLWPESLVAASGRKGAAYYGLKPLARYLYAKADRIIVLARGSGQYLERAGVPAERLAYLPNGVDTTAFDVPRDRSTAPSPFRLVYLGAHGPANGLDVVLRAADLLRSDGNVEILLVGDGPLKADLRQKATDLGLTNLRFLDPVPKTEVPSLLGKMDAGLMVLRDAPLFRYGVSPNKLFDYLAAQLPVVCNVPGEVADHLYSARAGVQARDASPEALAQAIQTLRARGPEAQAKMGANGREWVEHNHGRNVLADRMNALLRELV